MKINGNTKVSKLIKENKEAIELIAPLDPQFAMLRIPVLRWLFVPRLTLAQAALMGNCQLQELLCKLSNIGFKMEYDLVEESKRLLEFTKKLYFLDGLNSYSFDSRPLLAKNENLFVVILKELKRLEANEAIEIVNDFEPVSLIKYLKRSGYQIMTIADEGIYHIYFKKGENVKEEENSLHLKQTIEFENIMTA